ncbi:hypothetical protein OAH88_02340 [Candidatus Pelagibacter sp.]|nr:hypothetical protein [Candidatus Pelagibacter sp.]
MSSEQSINIKAIQTGNIEIDSKNTTEKINDRVDINSLLMKLREKEKLQKKENLLFFGLVGLVIFIIGIISFL